MGSVQYEGCAGVVSVAESLRVQGWRNDVAVSEHIFSKAEGIAPRRTYARLQHAP